MGLFFSFLKEKNIPICFPQGGLLLPALAETNRIVFNISTYFSTEVINVSSHLRPRDNTGYSIRDHSNEHISCLGA